ncbi:ATP-dependent zinc metalloprotease FtsH [Candidatus Saccharibacteria bacterium]|nr:ATP-dependent zinc metalloprotease FtsH [Candidatus Saccharibacteria bacterium]
MPKNSVTPKASHKKPSAKTSNYLRTFIFLFLVVLLCSALFNSLSGSSRTLETVPLSSVISRANDPNGDISKITVSGNDLTITLKGKDYPTEKSRKDASGTLYDQGLVDYCAKLESSADVAISDAELSACKASYPVIEYVESTNIWSTVLDLAFVILPVVALVIFFSYMMRQAQSMNSQNISFGKAKAQVYGPDKKRVTFKDVAGNEAAKQDLEEIVDFLKRPRKYETLGAKIPRGVLLAGDPGTGKTLMARAVAGEAGVPFFSISGSEFAEMFVGVGASRVRDLFQKAKKNAPSIIFIDEIDAVAHKRDARGGAGREDEQTLNQILVEMDGFDNESGVIVIAATNRLDMLDKALLRPGRFDRHVNVTLPERKDRLEILQVHFKNKPVSKDVDLDALAAKTAGSAGADLANIANEAAITAARKGHNEITNADLTEAFERVAIGPERKSKVMNDKERKITAYHEAGHAIVGHVLPDSDPVHKVTIIPRGRTGGVTWFLPPEDRSYKNIYELKDILARAMGGRIAEKLIFGPEAITTGAGSDLQNVATLAREMVVEEGMGQKTRNLVFPEEDSGRYVIQTSSTYSNKTIELIDEEIRHLTEEAALRAETVLRANQKVLDELAAKLLEKETLEEKELQPILKPATLPASAKLHS